MAGDSAARFVPERLSLDSLRQAAAGCTGCLLYRNATQTVFGEGPVDADVMFVGEQPGDQEDRRGHPFVGPAGRVLEEALAEVRLDASRVYLTNAVKHFKWKPQGKRRLHQKPGRTEMAACRPWLDAELELVKPAVLVLLGATAAQGLLGPGFRVSKERGRVDNTGLAPMVVATVHPSSILRASDDRARAMADFVQDLGLVLAGLSATAPAGHAGAAESDDLRRDRPVPPATRRLRVGKRAKVSKPATAGKVGSKARGPRTRSPAPRTPAPRGRRRSADQPTSRSDT